MRFCDFSELERLVTKQFALGQSSIHGPEHWAEVEKYGVELSKATGADEFVVRLFAWLHDSQRIDDEVDPNHGRRAAEFARGLRGSVFDLEDAAFAKLILACELHSDSVHHDDLTIGTCWDADRLDLNRLDPEQNDLIDPAFMSTARGREIAISKKKTEPNRVGGGI